MPYKDPIKRAECKRKNNLRAKNENRPEPTIETDAPDGTKTQVCPQCNERKPLTHFELLPADCRCTACVPLDVHRAKSQELVDRAQRKLAQILDANAKSAGLPALEQLINGLYGAWGGVNTFCHDIKDGFDALVAQKKYKQAVDVQLGVLKLHARVDKMRQEDDWRQMDDDRLKESLQLQLMNLLADDEKLKAMGDLLRANSQDPDKVLYGIISEQPQS